MADAATTSERDTLMAGPPGQVKRILVKEDEILLKGTICMLDASGLAIAGATATTLLPGGRVKTTVDATNDATLYVEIEEGIFGWTNAISGNAITAADIGKPAYVLNNQTVTDTSTGASKLGKIHSLDADGRVFVETRFGIV